MRLESLILRNFRQYADTRVTFGPGVTAIVGPNGSGKTTLLEAIAWTLYGSPAIRGNTDSLRRAGAPARSAVEARLEFTLGSHAYRIVRRTDRAELFLDGSPSPVHTGVAPVTEAVRHLLGMDYRAFFTSYFTGQKEIAFLEGMGRQERAMAVGRMLGYERLSRARERSNQDRLALEREIAALSSSLGDPEEMAAARKAAEAARRSAEKTETGASKLHEKARKALDAVKPRHEGSMGRKEAHDVLARELALAENDLKHIGAEVEACRREIARLDELSEEIRRLRTDIEEYRAAEKDFDSMRPLLPYEKKRRELAGRRQSLVERIEELQTRSKGRETANTVLNAARADVAAVEAGIAAARDEASRRREEWSRERGELQAVARSLEDSRKKLMERRRRVANLGEEGDCPTCLRPLGRDYPSVIGHFDTELKEIDEQSNAAKARLQLLGIEPPGDGEANRKIAEREADLARLRRQAEETSQRLQEIITAEQDLGARNMELKGIDNELSELPGGFDNERFERLSEIAREKKPAYRRGLEIEAELKKRPDWTFRLNEAEAGWAEKAESHDRIEASIRKLGFDLEAHDRIVAEFNGAVLAEAEAREALYAARQERMKAEGALELVRHQEEENAKKAAALAERQSRRLQLRTLTVAMESLRHDLSARVRPDLEEVAGDFLRELTDGRYSRIELTEQYEPIIIDDGERKPVISGGEEDVLHLCLRLAVSRMIAEASGQPLSLLVLDEIFGSLDAGRRDNVVTLIQRLKMVFDQIILITHIESIHDAVDQCLWVRYDSETRASEITDAESPGAEGWLFGEGGDGEGDSIRAWAGGSMAGETMGDGSPVGSGFLPEGAGETE